jgi:hypothetical protein
VHAFSRCGERGVGRFRPEDLTDPFADLAPKRGNSRGDMLMRLDSDDSDDFRESSPVEPGSLLW